MSKKPKLMRDFHLIFLDELRNSGQCNMFAAAPILQTAYDHLSMKDSRDILRYWQDTFTERHAK